mgnify:CR=1 FL=1
MGNIKIIKGVFDTKLELEHAGIAAGFPSPADEYRHETLDFNRDYIRHPEASFYGDVDGDSMRDAGLLDGDRVIQKMRRLDEVIDRINRMHGSETIVIGAQQYTQKNGKGKAEVFANGSISCVDKLKELLNKLSVCIHILNH